MGKNNRERRAAKAKQRIKGRARQAPGRHSDVPLAGDRWQQPLSDAERVRMLVEAVVNARLEGDVAGASELVDALARHDERVVVLEVGAKLRRALPVLWDAGWQPAEIVGHARRSSARAGRLVPPPSSPTMLTAPPPPSTLAGLPR